MALLQSLPPTVLMGVQTMSVPGFSGAAAQLLTIQSSGMFIPALCWSALAITGRRDASEGTLLWVAPVVLWALLSVAVIFPARGQSRLVLGLVLARAVMGIPAFLAIGGVGGFVTIMLARFNSSPEPGTGPVAVAAISGLVAEALVIAGCVRAWRHRRSSRRMQQLSP